MARCASQPVACRDQAVPKTHSVGAEFGTELADLDWIDGFIARVRPYVRVRPEDGVLIKMPTEVHKLNASGIAIVGRALRGERIRQVALSLGAADHPERVSQIHALFCDVRDLLDNRMGDGTNRRATNVTRFEGSFSRYPVLSEIAVTYRCNLACTFCYAGCGTGDATPGIPGKERHRGWWYPWRRWGRLNGTRPKRDPVAEEMTADEVMRVIDDIAGVGKVPSVSFTGGECTLRPELPDFIARARSRDMRVNIITNGIRCADRAYVDTLAAAGLTSAQVSVEGSSPDVHDRLTQRPGSFAKTIRGIEALRDAGLHVHTNTTICDENADDLTGIIDLANRLGLPHVSMNHIIPTGTPALRRHQRVRLSYERIGEHVMRAKRHAERVGIDLHWYSPTPFCLFNPVAHGLGNKGCAACDGLLHVSPSGEVLPCSSFSRGVGNMLESDLASVWFGREARYYKTKRMAPSVCRVCKHFALCQGACTLYWSAMGRRELYRAIARRAVGRIAALLGRDPKPDGTRQETHDHGRQCTA